MKFTIPTLCEDRMRMRANPQVTMEPDRKAFLFPYHIHHLLAPSWVKNDRLFLASTHSYYLPSRQLQLHT